MVYFYLLERVFCHSFEVKSLPHVFGFVALRELQAKHAVDDVSVVFTDVGVKRCRNPSKAAKRFPPPATPRLEISSRTPNHELLCYCTATLAETYVSVESDVPGDFPDEMKAM